MAVDKQARNEIAALKIRVDTLETKTANQHQRIKALEDLLKAGTGADMVARVGSNGIAYSPGQLTIEANTVIGLVE